MRVWVQLYQSRPISSLVLCFVGHLIECVADQNGTIREVALLGIVLNVKGVVLHLLL